MNSGGVAQFHTPILIPVVSASAVPAPSAGTGSLYTKYTDNHIYYQDSLGTEYDLTSTGGGGSPGGSDTQIQYNNGGSFGGTADLTFNDSTGDITVGASTGDAKMFFRDSGIYAYSKADGQFDIISDTYLGLTGSGDLPSAIGILASAGGIDIDAVGAAGQDINITNTGGSVHLTATEDAVNAISLTSNSIYFNGGDQDDSYLFYSKPLYLDIITTPGTTTAKLWCSAGYILNWGGLGLTVTGSGHFNKTGADYNFQVESADNTHMLFVDGGDNTVAAGGIDATNHKDGFAVFNDFNGTTFENTLADGQFGTGEVLRYSPGADDTLTAGQIYFLHTDGTWNSTDSDAVATGGSQMLGVGLGGSARTVGVLTRGFIRIPSTEILNLPGSGACDGLPVYISTTTGHFDFTAPSASGDFVRIVGYAIDDSGGDVLVYFDPDKTYVEIA